MMGALGMMGMLGNVGNFCGSFGFGVWMGIAAGAKLGLGFTDREVPGMGCGMRARIAAGAHWVTECSAERVGD